MFKFENAKMAYVMFTYLEDIMDFKSMDGMEI